MEDGCLGGLHCAKLQPPDRKKLPNWVTGKEARGGEGPNNPLNIQEIPL